MAQVGVKNGKLRLFYPSDAPPRVTQQDRERVQVLRGGLRCTLLPRGLVLLQDVGIQCKDVFILVVDNDRTSVACMLAAMELECVCLVISTSRIGLLQHAQEQTGITKVVVVKDASDVVELQQDSAPSANGMHLPWLNESAIAAGGCVCMLTSGSIGAPKVVACTWSRMLLQGQSTQEQLFPSGPARIVCATSISHAYSINALFALFTSPHDNQSELCFAPTIAGLHSLLAEPKEKFTLLYGTPATYTALLDLPAVTMNVDVPYCAGTRMQLDLFYQVYKHCGLQVMQNYGSTETGDIAAWSLFGKTFDDEKLEMDANSGCIYTGSLWPGVKAEIESTGEVLITTPWQALGYIRERALQGFQGRPHRTADIGFMKQDRCGIECLWLQDRLRPSVHAVSAGVASSHAPKQIEDAVTDHPDVTDALVLMQQNKSNRSGAHETADAQLPPVRVRAVLKDDAVVRVEDLVEWCAKKYPDLRDSLSVEFVHCLPCSPAGKLIYA
uniref:AMP-dependent synthetase/ligase domain-containing protein n=1 Tax=Globisporangium ultimum (strain ATCC 200006 / CBS 805.95 / DAOM BR144) TaxID=431595 RepID=K3WK80_GLOUD